MAKYYYLVAGLPDITLDDSKLNYTVEDFKAEIYPELTQKDKELIDLYYLKYDNENLLKLLKNKEAEINPRGNYTADQLLELISSVKEGDSTGKYPAYFSKFLSAYFNTPSEDIRLPEDLLSLYYYEYAINNDNKFIASWFEFNLNLNNIFAALTARKYKRDIAPYIVGNTEVSDVLRSSNARDFGLSASLIYFEQLVRISDIHEIVEREKKLDLLKWDWLEEESFFNYFSVEQLFVFLMKLEMIERWISLDKETGNKLFRQLINSLKDDVQIPEEFGK